MSGWSTRIRTAIDRRRMRKVSADTATDVSSTEVASADVPSPEVPAQAAVEQETFDYLGYDVPVDLAMMTGGGPETFSAIASGHQHLLKRWIHVGSSDRVLEIGCGVGRDAIPMTKLLTSGTYIGVDVIRPSIDWLESNVSPHFPNFSFVHLDVNDHLHNPQGREDMTNISLPMEEGSVDKIFLFSVFTHLFKEEVEHYLGEFRRVLAPGGMVYANAFLVDDDVLETARDTDLTEWHLEFRQEIEPGVYLNDSDSPRGAVAYETEVFADMLRRSGLDVVQKLRGSWSGYYDDPDEGQDAVVLAQPAD